MPSWNSEQYLRFKKERTQPSLDLISRLKEHQCILDIGSGPGNSTKALQNRYPDAFIVGAECDSNMLKKARENYPDISFVQAKMPQDFSLFQTFDCIFSNACIHWIPEQEMLFQEIYNHLEKGGEVAIQLPMTRKSPFYKVLHNLVDTSYPELNGIEEYYNLDGYGYYNLLKRTGFTNIQMWETTYVHHLECIEDVIEWYAGSGLKPYLDHIENRREEFLKDLKLKLEKQYVQLEDGTYFLFMPRLFMVAQK